MGLALDSGAFICLFNEKCHIAGSVDRGLYRVHQFSKVEMFVLCTPQQSEGILEELCRIEEDMFQELGLHYKVLVSPSLFSFVPSATHCSHHQIMVLQL